MMHRLVYALDMARLSDMYFTFGGALHKLEAHDKKCQETYAIRARHQRATRRPRRRAPADEFADPARGARVGDRQRARMVRLSDLRLLREDHRACVFSGRQRLLV